MSDYPEHIKLTAISDQSQACYDFIEWLESEKGYRLQDQDDMPISSMRVLLAEFFEIDMDKIEAEKRAMVDALREGA